MCNKNVEEWCINAPWGKIALIAWGDPKNEPVLLVHGFMDTAASFLFLLDHLTDTYYYVGFDIPGHGKSDPFPKGTSITLLHAVEALRRVVEYMKWKSFNYMAHSMGCIIGLYYQHMYPGFISKMLLLDPVVSMSIHYSIEHQHKHWFSKAYSQYYKNYQKLNSEGKLYTYGSAVRSIVEKRGLSEKQAEVLLSRSLLPVGEDSYKLSWDLRMKTFTPIPLPEETLYLVMSKVPPTLIVDASESLTEFIPNNYSNDLFKRCERDVQHYYRVTVKGGHDVHIKNPELVAPHILKFLKCHEENYGNIFGKANL